MKTNTLTPGERFFQEIRKTTFRKENFEYIHTGIIDEAGDCWTTTELDEANIFQVYNQYRVKHGIPFPDEIIALRKHYGLSAAKMSQILGFGINQYRNYEDGEVPSISNARVIIAAREKDVFLTFLSATKSDLTEAEYTRIKNKIESVKGDFQMAGAPSETSGYVSLSIDKIAAVVKLILSNIGPTFVTKMNKLMFYCDFIHYKKHGYGITGLTYRALQYGPVPESWGKIYASLPEINMEEYVYPSGQSGVQLVTQIKSENSLLSDLELQTVGRVCKLFTDTSAGEISKISHLETAWTANNDRHSIISYQEAFSLNYD
jgi:transcriptional regulator with XRE-family HTH domain